MKLIWEARSGPPMMSALSSCAPSSTGLHFSLGGATISKACSRTCCAMRPKDDFLRPSREVVRLKSRHHIRKELYGGESSAGNIPSYNPGRFHGLSGGHGEGRRAGRVSGHCWRRPTRFLGLRLLPHQDCEFGLLNVFEQGTTT